MFYNPVGNTQSSYFCAIVMVGHEFYNGTSESSLYRSIFHCQDLVVLRKYFMKQLFIQGLRKTHIKMTNFNVQLCQPFTNFDGIISNVPNSKDSKFLTFLDLST